MDVLIGGVSAEQYHATLLTYVISPAKVEVYTDWMRKALTPLRYGNQKKYVEIKMTLLVQDTDADSVQTDMSNLSNALAENTLKFSNRSTYYDAWTASGAEPTLVNPRTYQYDITLNAAYGYLPAVSQTLTGQTGTISAQGNLPSPAVVTLTPTQDIGALTLTGFTKRPIVVHSLHAGAPVVIDGQGIVTEADLDTVMTENMGAGKWMMRKYSKPNIFSPDTTHAGYVPTKGLIPDGSYMQQLIDDDATLFQGGGDNYLGWMRTGLYVASTKSITFKFLHDDGVSVFFNGAVVYSHDSAEVNNYWNPGYPSVTLQLPAGWSTLEFLWLNHYGEDGIWGITPTIGSQVDKINCSHASSAGVSGTANKFPDTDLWSFPVLQPGKNQISIDSAVCGIRVEYNPKFM